MFRTICLVYLCVLAIANPAFVAWALLWGRANPWHGRPTYPASPAGGTNDECHAGP